MKNNVKMYSMMLVMFVTAIGCKKEAQVSPAIATDTPAKKLEAKTYTDIPYGEDNAQKMDVYLPEGRTDATPVIVLLHGGGFIAGDKKDFSNQSATLSAKGYVVLNVNYRLVDSTGALSIPVTHKPSAVKIAGQVADIQAAVKYAAVKQSEWVMSSTQWAMTGHSAGATLAMLYSYGDANGDKRIKACGNWAGATTFAFSDESEANVLDKRLVEILYRAVGAELKNENKLAYMAASPYWVASLHGGIPTINVRPEDNTVAGPDNSKSEYQQFTDLLNGKGVPNKLVEVQGADHGFSRSGNWDIVLNETDVFFKASIK